MACLRFCTGSLLPFSSGRGEEHDGGLHVKFGAGKPAGRKREQATRTPKNLIANFFDAGLPSFYL